MHREDNDLTSESLNKLLALFDFDPERAAERYEFIRMGLIKYFESRGCASAVDLADETIDRVTRKVSEGASVPSDALVSYFYGFARNILKENSRRPDKRSVALDDLPLSKHPAHEPVKLDLWKQEKITLEQRLECLEVCLQEFPPETQNLIISYYEGELGAKIDHRKLIAATLGISINNLRIRAHRIREKLEICLFECLKKQASV